MSGRWLAVSAPFLDLHGFVTTGSAAVYERRGSEWTLSGILAPEPSDVTASGYLFGMDIAVDQDRVVVTATGEGMTQGALGHVHVFDYDESLGWQRTARLDAPMPSTRRFGLDVELSGNTIVVGESGQGSPVTGRAHVYERGASGWSYSALLRPSDPLVSGAFGDQFGASVAVDGSMVAIGATNARGTTDSPLDGALYIFKRDPVAGWPSIESEKLIGGDPLDGGVGLTLALDRGTAVCGAYGYNPTVGIAHAYVFAVGLGTDVCSGEEAGCAFSSQKPPRLDVLEVEPDATRLALWGVTPGCAYIVVGSAGAPQATAPIGTSRPLCINRGAVRLAVGSTSSTVGAHYFDVYIPSGLEQAAAMAGGLTVQAWLRSPQAGPRGSTNAVMVER